MIRDARSYLSVLEVICGGHKFPTKIPEFYISGIFPQSDWFSSAIALPCQSTQWRLTRWRMEWRIRDSHCWSCRCNPTRGRRGWADRYTRWPDKESQRVYWFTPHTWCSCQRGNEDRAWKYCEQGRDGQRYIRGNVYWMQVARLNDLVVHILIVLFMFRLSAASHDRADCDKRKYEQVLNKMNKPCPE